MDLRIGIERLRVDQDRVGVASSLEVLVALALDVPAHGHRPAHHCSIGSLHDLPIVGGLASSCSKTPPAPSPLPALPQKIPPACAPV